MPWCLSMHLRHGVDCIHGQSVWRVEGGEELLAEFICTCKKRGLARQRVRRKQSAKVTNDSFKEWHIFILNKAIKQLFALMSFLTYSIHMERHVRDYRHRVLKLIFQIHDPHRIQRVNQGDAPPVEAGSIVDNQCDDHCRTYGTYLSVALLVNGNSSSCAPAYCMYPLCACRKVCLTCSARMYHTDEGFAGGYGLNFGGGLLCLGTPRW